MLESTRLKQTTGMLYAAGTVPSRSKPYQSLQRQNANPIGWMDHAVKILGQGIKLRSVETFVWSQDVQNQSISIEIEQTP